MKYLPVFLIALFSISFLSCISDQEGNTPPPEVPIETPELAPLAGILIGFENFKIVGEFEKEIDTSLTMDEVLKMECENWTFELAALENVLQKMEEVSSSDAYNLCYQYPCQYNGMISDGILTYRMSVHSGGHIVIKTETEGEELNFILKEDFEGHPFFGVCDCCE